MWVLLAGVIDATPWAVAAVVVVALGRRAPRPAGLLLAVCALRIGFTALDTLLQLTWGGVDWSSAWFLVGYAVKCAELSLGFAAVVVSRPSRRREEDG